MKLLVTGGTGYVGSFTVKQLQAVGFEVVVFDNLEYGHKNAVDCQIVKGDLKDQSQIAKVFKIQNFDAVLHFASYIAAGESMQNPGKYFVNNISGGINLLEAAVAANVKKLIFSSTAAVYGYPDKLPITEDDLKIPINVYGESKLTLEKILSWYEKVYGIKSISLRYFNAAGASFDGLFGEDHKPETHIIPLACFAALGKTDFSLYGNDYPTKDGTCIRDYIHVLDLANAHVKALDYIFEKNQSDAFNLGTGFGHSNLEVIKTVKEISGVDFKVKIAKPRSGDPSELYTSNSKAKKILGWSPKYSDLKTVVKTAWKWHKFHPNGFSK